MICFKRIATITSYLSHISSVPSTFCFCAYETGRLFVTESISFSMSSYFSICLNNSLFTLPTTAAYFSKDSLTPTSIASLTSEGTPSRSVLYVQISASRKSSHLVNPTSFALLFPSISMRTTSFCNFTTCFISATIPISYRSDCIGSSTSTSRCVTRKIFWSACMDSSTAFSERSLLMSK